MKTKKPKTTDRSDAYFMCLRKKFVKHIRAATSLAEEMDSFTDDGEDLENNFVDRLAQANEATIELSDITGNWIHFEREGSSRRLGRLGPGRIHVASRLHAGEREAVVAVMQNKFRNLFI